MQLLIHGTIYISRAFPRVLLQQLRNLCKIFRRQFHFSCSQIFQGTLRVPVAPATRVYELGDRRTRCGVDKKNNSRGSRKRDDVVAKRTNPCETQLGDCDPLAACYGRQVVHELEVMPDVLGTSIYVSQVQAGERIALRLTSSWKRPKVRLASSSARSLRLLI